MNRSAPPAAEPLPMERSCPFDPPDAYRRLRADGPVTRLRLPDGRLGWVVTGFAEVRALLADQRFSARNDRLVPPVPTEMHNPLPPEPGVFNKMDPPDHARYRRLLAGHFTVRRSRELTDLAERITGEQIDALLAAGSPADLVEHWADPIAARLICAWLGIEESERPLLQHHLLPFTRLNTPLDRCHQSLRVLNRTATALVARKADEPAADLVSALGSTGELEPTELVNITLLLLSGGVDTTANLLALGVYALLEHPEQLARLRAEPALIDGAVEELTRYLTISHLGASRSALCDVELGGELIQEGEIVVAALPAANRDPERFPDPDALDIGRADLSHLAFGHGVHQCLGQHFARMTLRVAYRELLTRLPTLRLAATADQIRMRGEMIHYGVHQLPVAWE